jgi:hypothetical protein
MAKPATKITKDLGVREDAAVKGGSTISTTIKNLGDALSTAARKG